MPVPPCSDWSLRDPRRLARIIAVNAWLMDLEARVHRGEWGVKVIMFSSGVSLFVRIFSSGLLQTSLSCFCGLPWGAGFSSSIHRADSWPLRLGNREAWWFTTRREIELENDHRLFSILFKNCWLWSFDYSIDLSLVNFINKNMWIETNKPFDKRAIKTINSRINFLPGLWKLLPFADWGKCSFVMNSDIYWARWLC